MKSRIYAGNVYHVRHTPKHHGFQYGVRYLYLDLDEIEVVANAIPLFGIERFNLISFFRQDYLPSERGLKEEVCHHIALATGILFRGSVRLLAAPRCLGYLMNPIVLFYCFDEHDELRFVVAEVTNTPWGERHVYVVDLMNTDNTDKIFHVSPFMPMNLKYNWRLEPPGEYLDFDIQLENRGDKVFEAGLRLREIPLQLSIIPALAFQPFKTLTAIYKEAAALALKQLPFYLHPKLRQRIDQELASIAAEDPALSVTITDERFYTLLATGGAIGAAEAYMAGYWRCGDMTGLLQTILRRRDMLAEVERGAIRKPLYKLAHFLNRDSRRGSKRNIAAHYDLGNDFFALFLDPTMTYSAGYFERGDATMACASAAKLDRICQKLELEPGDHVLEIGTGWGSFAIHAALNYGCHVTTTTISDEQYELAGQRIVEAGVADRVSLLKQDYRDLGGSYDKLVSIEMIEAVGLRFIGGYFKRCAHLLKADGRMLIQAITIADQHYDRARKNVDFIQKYIFPGGALPSVTTLTRDATAHSDLRLLHLDDMGEHYAETLRRWRARFFENLEAIKALGYDDRFLRMWEYYLCYCEAGFDERHVGCVQATFHKPGYRGSIAP